VTVNGMSPNRGINRAMPKSGRDGGEGEVRFFDLPICESPRKGPMGGIRFRHDQTTAGFLVETMDNARTLDASNTGQILTMMKQGGHQRSVSVPGAGMNDHPGGFVDDDQGFVLIKNIQRDVFRGGGLAGNGIRLKPRHHVPEAYGVCGSGRGLIMPGISRPNDCLNTGTGVVGQAIGQKAIQAQPHILRQNVKGMAIRHWSANFFAKGVSGR
jgi:hypothetical protein